MARNPRYLGVRFANLGGGVDSKVHHALTRYHEALNNIQVLRGNTPVLMIRLARVGARKQPHYRVVVIEKDRARNGRSVEVVGTYNPRTNPASVELKRDRIDYWTGKGAQLSERVGKLLAKAQAAEQEPAVVAA
jgi:small subunit ribosomal protein S16